MVFFALFYIILQKKMEKMQFGTNSSNISNNAFYGKKKTHLWPKQQQMFCLGLFLSPLLLPSRIS